MSVNLSGVNVTGASIGAAAQGGGGGDSTALYTFSSFTFTSANVAGRSGPTLSQCLANYNTVDNSWLNDTNFYNVPIQGIQLWTVPKSGTYRITAAGARGGKSHSSNLEGGFGAQIIADISLVKNDKIAIVVGQEGEDRSNAGVTYQGAAGGGGSFVYDNTTSTFYIVAGGGGGAASTRNNLLTNQTTAHGKGDTIHGTNVTIRNGWVANGGRDGRGGNISSRGTLHGGPGAGILSDGQAANGLQGRSKDNNWLGGNIIINSPNAVKGGFGGGGGAGNGANSVPNAASVWAGGGGGYSGGGSGGNGGAADGQYGGGGGSYTISGHVSNVSGINNSNGYVIVTFIS
jgi:hypothetical protein